MTLGFVLTLVAAGAWFLVLVFSVRRNWFARFKRGFRLTLMVSLISIAVWSSLLIAYWGYSSAHKILIKDTDAEMSSMATVVQRQVNDAIQDAQQEVRPASEALSHAAEHGELPTEALHEFNPLFVDAHVVKEPFDRASLMHPRFLPAAHTYAVDIEVPTHHVECAPESFVVSYDIGKVLNRLVGTVRFGNTGYVVVVNDDGHVIAHSDSARVGDDISTYEAVRRVRSGSQDYEPVEDVNKAGVSRLFGYRPVFLPKNKRPLTVLTEMNVSEVEQPVRRLLKQFALGFSILAVLGVVLATQISSSVHEPLEDLLALVHRIENGIFSTRSGQKRNDEIGQLGSSLDRMTNALEERDHVKELFGKYVTTQISEEVLKGHVNLGGATRRVTMLISDIRGFTAMSEEMTAEQVVLFLNEYFSEMVDAVFEYGGVLDKFLGDGLLAVYGALSEDADHPRRAVASALRMQARLAKINKARDERGLAPIRIGIGIHTGEVVVGNIGSQKRLEYTVIGDGVNITSRLEALNKELATMILISEETYEAVKDQFECVHMPEAKLRGRTKVIQFYEVIGAKGAPLPETPANRKKVAL